MNGKRVNMFTREELDSMLIEHNGQLVEIADSSVNDNSEVAESSLGEQQLQASVLERIPKDEQGNPIYEQAETPDVAWDAIVEQTEGDEAMAQSVADGMVADKEAVLKKVEKTKSAGGNTIAEKIAAEKERKAAIDAAKQELSIWQKIAGTANRRKWKQMRSADALPMKLPHCARRKKKNCVQSVRKQNARNVKHLTEFPI